MTDIDRRTVLGAGVALAVPGALMAQPGRAPLRPEDFGAKGDGVSDDTLAFQALGKAVSDAGSGTIVLRRDATYRVGRQTRGAGDGPAFLQQPMLRITGAQGVTILGQGATIKLNDGLRYGSFDPATGQRFDPPKGKFTDPRYAASVGALVELRSCRRVRIERLTLDGNVDRLVVGGRWNVDIQLHADGLQLVDVGSVVVEGVVARDNGLDGVYLRGNGRASPSAASDDIRFHDVRCARNGRQGVSIVGGTGMRFAGCVFADTGQGPVSSAPGAGVDIEPNGRDWASDIGFDACTFINNRGVGLVAAEGASHGIAVRGCTFWQGFARAGGGSGDAFWLTKDGVAISDCRVHGNVTNLAESATVTGSSFDDADHPAYGHSAQRRKYLLAGARGSFTDCTFTVRGAGPLALIYATKPAIFRRCLMRYAGTGLSGNVAVAFLGAAATLEDVTFTEGPRIGPTARYIFDGHAMLKGRVTVTGPRIRWGNKSGPIGNVAALPRK